MDRHREVRRGSMAAANGLSRRRQRSSSLRDSPEEDGGVELQETTRLRDRGGNSSSNSKKDRDRLSRNKRRRGGDNRLMHHEGGEESTEDSLDDDEEDEDEEAGPSSVRMRPPNHPSSSSSLANHHQQHRKSFPPAKVVRAAAPWKVSDEMGFSVPKKARSVSTKRSHECWVSGGGGGGGGSGGGVSGEQLHRQASTSPARQPTSVVAVSPSLASPASPSSSSASIRKKMKPIGAKHRPPKISNNSNNKPSSIQDEIEIEVAEVLYGLMRQSQCPSRQEIVPNSSQKLDSRDTNGSGNDAKSRVSSPISASPSSAPSLLSKNSSSSNIPMSAVAPKRKRPRPQVKFDEDNKIETEQASARIEVSSTKLVKISGSVENYNGVSFDFGSSQVTTTKTEELAKPESVNPIITDSKTLKTEESSSLVHRDHQQGVDQIQSRKKVVVAEPKKESSSSSCAKVEFDPENVTASHNHHHNKATPTASVVESHRGEESYKIDLMAPPLKSSPERDSEMGGFVSDSKSMACDTEMKMESGEIKGKENVDANGKKDIEEAVLLEKKTVEVMVDECESQKSISQKQHTMLDLQIDLDKHNKDGGPNAVRQQQQQQQQLHIHQQQQQQQQQSKAVTRNEPKLEKAAQSTSSSLPLPMTIAGWPGGLPPPMGNGMGQVRPLQGMMPMDGAPGSSNSIQPSPFTLSQPRSKRCATHYYIARNIYYQQFAKVNPFWPAAAGTASLYGNKPYNLNVLPPAETAIIGNPLLGSLPMRNLNSMQDKGPVEGAKDKSSVAANFIDPPQGKLAPKQLVLQQPPQQAALHGPAFIFPLNQQQAVLAAGSKAGAAKSSNAGNAASSIAAQSTAGASGNSSSSSSAAAIAAAAPTTMSFNYPNMPGAEAQYVAILQNNGYPFPVPAPAYRGTSPQALPFFNGSFYSSQMMHPSQLQQQQQLQQQLQQSQSQQQQQQQQLQQQLQQSHSQQQPVQQGHPNTSTSSGSSSSQKHQQNQQQRLQGGGGNPASGNSNSFPASKNRQQKQQNQSYPVAHHGRQHEADMAVEDGPSTEDTRISQAHKNMYNHNFAMPIHPKNFASMSSAAVPGGGSGSHSERQQQSLKGGAELIPTQAFAMPFASFNGGTAVSGLDFSSMAQNHVIFQSLPEAARQGYQMAAAAAAAQVAHQKKTQQISEEGKTVGDSNNADDERKASSGKGQPSVAQAIVFSRPDSTDPSVSTILESSARTLNLISSPGNGNRTSRPNTSTTTTASTPSTTVNTSNSQQHQQMNQLIQLQKQQHQHQQMQVMHQQQQQLHQQLAAAAAARGKPSTTSGNSVYSDNLSPSASMIGKFPNARYFTEALVQGGSSTQSPQWKNTRTSASPVSSPSLASTTSSLKNLPQQQGRTQQSHTQISFGVNSKPVSAQHGQQIPTGNQSPSPPVVVGSPPTSNTKSAGGSPRASSTGSKVGSAPSLSSQQQAKNSSSGPSRKSSPVSGRNVPSNLGNSHITPAPCSTTKSQSHQNQSLQHQQQKQALQQAQLFFSNAYMQAQSPQSTSGSANTTGTSNIGYYQQRRPPTEQQPGSSSTASSGMLSLSPSLTLAGTTTSDPTKAVAAAAAANMKGGLPPPGLLQAAQFATQSGGHQFMSAAFPYMHSVPGVQVKQTEQKQPAGNDNLHACWQPEKR